MSQSHHVISAGLTDELSKLRIENKLLREENEALKKEMNQPLSPPPSYAESKASHEPQPVVDSKKITCLKVRYAMNSIFYPGKGKLISEIDSDRKVNDLKKRVMDNWVFRVGEHEHSIDLFLGKRWLDGNKTLAEQGVPSDADITMHLTYRGS